MKPIVFHKIKSKDTYEFICDLLEKIHFMRMIERYVMVFDIF